MATLVEINDKYRFTFDQYNYMPEKFIPGGYEITFGTNKGKISQDRWQSYGTYFPNLPFMFNFLVQEEIRENEKISMEEFLAEYKRLTEYFAELMKPCVLNVITESE